MAWAGVLARGKHHLILLLNASAMMGSTLVTAGLGFAYWWVAARFLPAEQVGLASAAIATMGFLALAGDLGLGTLLIGQIPRHRGRVGELISAAFLVATVGSALLGLLYTLVVAQGSSSLAAFTGTVAEASVFIAGVALTGLVLVLDQTLLGLLMGPWHLARNISFALVKLILLGLTVGWGAHSAQAIYATWAGGNLVSLFVLALVVARTGNAHSNAGLRHPDLKLLRGLTGPILSHHALNVLSQAPGLLLPVLVTYVLSARVNAAFYTAWLLISVAYLAPASLTTALFAVAAREADMLARRLRFTLGVSMALAGVTILGCLALGAFALRLFNPEYAEVAQTTLVLLALAMPAVVVKYHYIALKRIREEMAGALPLLGLGAVAELVAAGLGGSWYGLSGLSAGWMLAGYAQVAWMLQPLLRAARPPSPVAPPPAPAPA